MKTVSRSIKVIALTALIGLPCAILVSEPPEAKTKPLKEVGYELFRTEVAPGAFLHEYFQEIRAQKGRQEDGATIVYHSSHNNFAGKTTYMSYQITFMELEGGLLVGDTYFWREAVAANEDRFASISNQTVYFAGPQAGTTEGVWEIVPGSGTGRFEGATGEGTVTSVFGGDPLVVYEAVGWISTVGSTK
jgi:hypothetical protein